MRGRGRAGRDGLGGREWSVGETGGGREKAGDRRQRMKQKSEQGRGDERELTNREWGGRRSAGQRGEEVEAGDSPDPKGKGPGKTEEEAEARRAAEPEDAQHPPLPPATEPGFLTSSPAGLGHRWAKLSQLSLWEMGATASQPQKDLEDGRPACGAGAPSLAQPALASSLNCFQADEITRAGSPGPRGPRGAVEPSPLGPTFVTVGV